MNFNIFLIGDKPENFYLEAIKEYAKRLTRYSKTNLFYLTNSHHFPPAKAGDKSYRIRITSSEQAVSSEQLALKIEQLALAGISDITFIIGTEAVDGTEAGTIPCAESLSLSSLTMDIGLQAVLIVEQLYRSYRIIKHEPYHK